MKKNKPIVALDADDVLLEGADFLHTCAKIALNAPELEKAGNHFDLTKRFNITSHDVSRVFKTFYERLHQQPAVSGAREITQELSRSHKIVIVTAIDAHGAELRKQCFKKNGIVFDELYASGAGCSKKEILAALNPVEFVDDRLTNLAAIAQLPFHKAWIEVPHEIQDIAHCESLYDTRHASLEQWWTCFKLRNSLP